MIAYRWSLLSVFLLLIIASVSGALPWDINTTSLHHFDKINMESLYQYDGNVTVDQSSKYWTQTSTGFVNEYRSTNCKFGQCVFFPTTSGGYSNVANETLVVGTAPDFYFGKEGNWTVEGWINLSVAPVANRNATLVSWMGYGDTGYKTLNGTHVYINSARMIGVTTPSTITGAPLIVSTTALTLNTWNSFAVVKNGSSIKLFVNGLQNATAATANAYNWSHGITNFMPDFYPSVGYDGWSTWSTAPVGALDEIRISNNSRYGGNYTPQTVEFFNPLNKTVAFSEIPAGTYNVGSTITSNNYISNTSHISKYSDFIDCASPTCSQIQQLGVTLPAGWTSSFNDSSSPEYTVSPSSIITSKTLIGQSAISLDSTGSFSSGSHIGSNSEYPESTFWLSNNPVTIPGTRNSFLATSYRANGTITDLSAASAQIYADDETMTLYPNIGQKINITVFGTLFYNSSGSTGTLVFNKSVWRASNIYNHPDTPYYDIAYTFNNNAGCVTFTAIYPQFNGITADPFSCPVGAPSDCGLEQYFNVEFYPVETAIGYPAGSSAITITPTTNYTAGNPFLNTNGYTYSHAYAFYGSYAPSGFTDNVIKTTIRLVNVNTGAPIVGAATVSYDARNASPASPTNVVGGTFDLFHRGGTFNVTAIADGYFTTIQTFTVGTGGTIDVLLTPLSGASTNLNILYPHEVRFMVVDTHGKPIPYLSTSFTMANSTTDGTNWITTIFGVSPLATDIEGTTVGGITDSFGYITFPVIGSALYRITFADASLGVAKTYYIHPSMNDYVLVVPTTASASIQSIGDFVTGNLTVLPQGANVYLNMSYNDTGLQTTNVNYFIVFPNQTTFYTKNFAGTPAFNQSVEFGYPVTNTRGDSYVWGYSATNSRWGMINRSQGITLKGVDGILFNPFVYKDRW